MFDRFLRHAGLFVMRSNLAVPTFDIGGVDLGQRARHAPMQVAPADKGKFGASDFAQAVVREIVLGSPRLSMIRRRQSSSSAWETLASSQSEAFSKSSKEKGRPTTLARAASS